MLYSRQRDQVIVPGALPVGRVWPEHRNISEADVVAAPGCVQGLDAAAVSGGEKLLVAGDRIRVEPQVIVVGVPEVKIRIFVTENPSSDHRIVLVTAGHVEDVIRISYADLRVFIIQDHGHLVIIVGGIPILREPAWGILIADEHEQPQPEFLRFCDQEVGLRTNHRRPGRFPPCSRRTRPAPSWRAFS